MSKRKGTTIQTDFLQKTPERNFSEYEIMVNSERSRHYSDGENIYENLSNIPKPRWNANTRAVSDHLKAATKNNKSTKVGNAIDSNHTNLDDMLTQRTKQSLLMELNGTDKLPKVIDKKGDSYYVLDIDKLIAGMKTNKTDDKHGEESNKLGSSGAKENTRETNKVEPLRIDQDSSIKSEENIKPTTVKVNRAPLPASRTLSSNTYVSRKNTARMDSNKQLGYTTPKPSRKAPPIPFHASNSVDRDIRPVKGRSFSDINRTNKNSMSPELNRKPPTTLHQGIRRDHLKDRRVYEQNEDFSTNSESCKQIAELSPKKVRDTKIPLKIPENSHKRQVFHLI